MRRVVIGIMVALMVGCVGLTGLGYFYGVPLLERALETGQDNVIQVMEDSLYDSSFDAIADGRDSAGTLRIRDRDLTVNNTAVAGEAGWETGTSGTVVYGFELGISPDGLSLGVGEEAMYSGVPAVIDGRLELTGIQVIDTPFWMDLMSDADFEQVVEDGLNDAFAASELVPTGLTLREGEMIVEVAPAIQDS